MTANTQPLYNPMELGNGIEARKKAHEKFSTQASQLETQYTAVQIPVHRTPSHTFLIYTLQHLV
jgi:hypothetical protein